MHWLEIRGAWMQVRFPSATHPFLPQPHILIPCLSFVLRKRERETRAMQMASGKPWETTTLATFSRDRALFPPLLAEARDAALRGQESRLVVHTAWGTEWHPFCCATA